MLPLGFVVRIIGIRSVICRLVQDGTVAQLALLVRIKTLSVLGIELIPNQGSFSNGLVSSSTSNLAVLVSRAYL